MRFALLSLLLLFSTSAFAVRPANILSFTSADCTASSNGSPIDISGIFSISLQSVSTVDCTGTLKLQVSNDVGPKSPGAPNTVTNWTDLSAATIAVTAASKLLLAKVEVSYQWVRVVWTASGGVSGVLNVRMKSMSY